MILDSFCAQSKKSGGVVVQEDCVRKLAEVQVRAGEEIFSKMLNSIFFYFTISVVELSCFSWYCNGAGWCFGVSCCWEYGI